MTSEYPWELADKLRGRIHEARDSGHDTVSVSVDDLDTVLNGAWQMIPDYSSDEVAGIHWLWSVIRGWDGQRQRRVLRYIQDRVADEATPQGEF